MRYTKAEIAASPAYWVTLAAEVAAPAAAEVAAPAEGDDDLDALFATWVAGATA